MKQRGLLKSCSDYPKVEIGTLEVFDVQADISFCFVRSNKTGKSFAVGSLLEAVPAGSISHLIDKEGRLVQAVSLNEQISRIIKQDKMPFVCIFCLYNADALLNEKGMAYVNNTLADIFSRLSKGIVWTDAIYQLEKFKFGVVGAIEAKEYGEKSLDCLKLLRDLRHSYHSGATVVAAMSPGGGFSYSHYFDYAHIAANVLLSTEPEELDEYVVFSTSVANRRFRQISRKGHPDQLQAEYERYASIDLRSGFFDNQMGVMEYGRGNIAKAVEYFVSAAEQLPEDNIVKANCAVAFYRLGDMNSALQRVEEVIKSDSEYRWAEYFIPTIGLIYFHGYLNQGGEYFRVQAKKYIDSGLTNPQLTQEMKLRLLKAASELDAPEDS